MLDENEFLGPYGVRSLSKFHPEHPYGFDVSGQDFWVEYLPAESDSGMFGGNSNWRGPVWMPVNVMIIKALLNFYLYYGDKFKIECPTGSGKTMNLFEVSKEIAERLTGSFLRDKADGGRSTAARRSFRGSPLARPHSFLRIFPRRQRGGLGASHQTGWTGLVATLIQLFGLLDPTRALEMGKAAAFHQGGGR